MIESEWIQESLHPYFAQKLHECRLQCPRVFLLASFTLFLLTISLVYSGSAVNPNSYPHELQWGQGTQCFHKMTAIYSNSQHQLYYLGIVNFARPTSSSRGQPSWFSPTETVYIPQALTGSRDGTWPLAEFSIPLPPGSGVFRSQCKLQSCQPNPKNSYSVVRVEVRRVEKWSQGIN